MNASASVRESAKWLEVGPVRRVAAMLVAGVALGVTLSMVGFTRYDEVHAMLTLRDARLFVVFGLGVVLTGIGLRVVPRFEEPNRIFHRGLIPGAALFGLGWALCGACPGALLAQIGEGQWRAWVALAGLVVGVRIERWIRARWLPFDRGSC